MNKTVFWVDQILRRTLMALMASIVLVVCWQVFSRFALGAPSSMTEEIARCLLLWIGMLGAAFAYRTGQHLGLDILTRKMPALWQHRVALVLTAAVVIFALAAMVVGGGQLVVLTYQLDQMSAALGIRVSWIYLALPLGGLLIAFYGLCQLRCLWQKIELTPAEDC